VLKPWVHLFTGYGLASASLVGGYWSRSLVRFYLPVSSLAHLMRIIVQVLAALFTTIPCYVTALASDRRYLPYPLTYTNRLSPSHRSRSRCNPYSVLVFSNSHSGWWQGKGSAMSKKPTARPTSYRASISRLVGTCLRQKPLIWGSLNGNGRCQWIFLR